MPIRIEHQPSAFAVGVVGYAAGQGKARERQGKQFLDLFQDQQRFQNQQQMLDQRNSWLDERDAKREWSTPPSLMKVPDWAGQKDKESIAKIDAGIYGIRSGKFRHDDENARQVFDDLMRQREEIMGRMQRPDPGEQASENWGYLNPKTGQRAKMGETQEDGMVLWDYAQGAPVGGAMQKAEQAASDKYRDELIRRTERIISEEEVPEGQEPMTRERARRKAEQEMYDDGIMPQGEKPHMGNPSLGPEITPLQGAGSGAGSAAASGAESVPEFDVVPGVGVRPVAPAGQRATPGASAALRDPNTRAVPIPNAPAGAGVVQPQADRPFETSVTPVVGDWVGPRPNPEQPMQDRQWAGTGPRPQRQPQDPAVEVVPGDWASWNMGSPDRLPVPVNQRRPVDEPASAGAPMSPSSGGVPNFHLGRPEDEPSSERPMSLPGAKEQVDVTSLPREMQQRIRRTYELGSKETRAAIERRYGPMQPISEMYPDQTPVAAAPPSPPSSARQHVEAMRGPHGTGEGVRSDAERMLGGIEGAGGIAGRTAAAERAGQGLADGGTRLTKYDIAQSPQEREAAMNERFDEATRKKWGREAAAAFSGFPQAKPRDPLDGIDAEAYKQKRLKEKQRRKANLQASKIRITTDAEYDRLLPGTTFTGPDGKVRRKV